MKSGKKGKRVVARSLPSFLYSRPYEDGGIPVARMYFNSDPRFKFVYVSMVTCNVGTSEKFELNKISHRIEPSAQLPVFRIVRKFQHSIYTVNSRFNFIDRCTDGCKRSRVCFRRLARNDIPLKSAYRHARGGTRVSINFNQRSRASAMSLVRSDMRDVARITHAGG